MLFTWMIVCVEWLVGPVAGMDLFGVAVVKQNDIVIVPRKHVSIAEIFERGGRVIQN